MGGNIIEFDALRIKREGILEGIRDGIREGMLEGKLEALCQVALDMMHDGYSGKEIMKIARKSRQEKDELAKDNGLTVIWNDKEACIN